MFPLCEHQNWGKDERVFGVLYLPSSTVNVPSVPQTDVLKLYHGGQLPPGWHTTPLALSE